MLKIITQHMVDSYQDVGIFGDLYSLSKLMLCFENKPLPSVEDIEAIITEEERKNANNRKRPYPYDESKDDDKNASLNALSKEGKLLLKMFRAEMMPAMISKITKDLQVTFEYE